MATIVNQQHRAGVTLMPVPSGRAGFIAAVRSELTKIRSVRSTYWTLIALFFVCVGIGALFSFGNVAHLHSVAGSPGYAHEVADARAHNVASSLFGLIIGQLIIVVLGAMTITSEYSTGMIRTSLSTMPRRGVLYAAKALVFAAIALVIGLLTSFTSFFIGQAILSSQHVGAALSQPGALRAVIGGGLFLAVCGMLAFGIGAMLRHSAGAISTSIGLLFVVWILSNFLPSTWAVDVDKWIPFNAGAGIWEQFTGQNMFSPWIGFAVFCGYAAIAIAGGLALFRKRDA